MIKSSWFFINYSKSISSEITFGLHQRFLPHSSLLPSLYPFLLVFVIIGFYSCSTDTKTNVTKPFANCQYGPPKAIFSKEIPKIKEHTFQLNAQTAVEQVAFDGGIQLELIQSGCEKPKQEFQFTIPTNTKSFNDGDWIAMSLDMFGLMGNLSESLKPFLIWRGALQKMENQLKLGLPVELEPSFFIKIDKVAGEQEGLLIIALYQE